MTNSFDWTPSPLSESDQRLVLAYTDVGVAVDQLPYTESMDEILKKTGAEVNDRERRFAFQRLMLLRKQGRLPRVARAS